MNKKSITTSKIYKSTSRFWAFAFLVAIFLQATTPGFAATEWRVSGLSSTGGANSGVGISGTSYNGNSSKGLIFTAGQSGQVIDAIGIRLIGVSPFNQSATLNLTIASVNQTTNALTGVLATDNVSFISPPGNNFATSKEYTFGPASLVNISQLNLVAGTKYAMTVWGANALVATLANASPYNASVYTDSQTAGFTFVGLETAGNANTSLNYYLAVGKNVADIPTITSFTPEFGAIGSSVTITGTNFNTTAAQNIVFFGATQAVVTAATATSLTVTAPLGATYQYLSVTNLALGLTAYSSKPFIVTLAGNVLFAVNSDFTTGSNPFSVSIGDIDGDGKADLAVANYNSSTVSVFRNTSTSGSVSFATKADFTTGTNPYSVSIGDLDGDGKPDLAVANNNSNTVSVLRNTSTSGSMSFATKVDFATDIKPRSVSIGDIDGDGKPDMAVATYNNSTVSVFRNTTTSGILNFDTKVDFATGTYPCAVSIGDIDGDGKADLATANYAGYSVSVLRNTSTSGTITAGSFATNVDFTTGSTPISVSIGDLDGDGKPDLAVANMIDNTVSVLKNTSTSGAITAGSFATKVDFTTGTFPYSVSIGDIDGDGKPDLAVANYSDRTVSVLRSTATSGSLSFDTKADFTTGSNPCSVSIGDIDGDGKPDLVAANSMDNTVSVIRQKSPPPTITSFTPASGAIGSSVTITGTNFNTTAAQNIVFFGATQAVVTAATATSLTVTAPLGATYQYLSVTNLALGLTAYSAKPFIVTLAGNVFFAVNSDFTTGSNPRSVSIGDIDGDGKPDLAVANYTSSTVSVLLNTSTSGTVSFATKADFTTGTNPYSVSIGDLDGDGKPDLAVANYTSNTVSVLLNTSTSGSLSFATNVDFTTGSRPYSVSIGDIDGDGKADLAVANSSSNSISVLLNTSTIGTITAGSFANRVNFTTGTNPRSVSIGDIDGDGKPDLAVANYTSSTVSVLLNTSTSGTVSFATKADFTTGTNPYSVSIGDIDGDGKPDLAVANYNSNTVSVLHSTSTSGSVSFDTKADFTTGSRPYSVSIGDIDGDGKPDLAMANYSSSTVSVLRSTSTSGSLSFDTKADFTTGTSPYSVSIGDIDGDGKPDLVAANSSSNTVSVIRQIIPPPTITSFTPASAGTGTYISITGTNFTGATAVSFGGTAASTFSVTTSTEITAVVGSGTTGIISVTTPDGTATSAETFTFKPAYLTNLANLILDNAAGNADTYWNGQAFTTGSNAFNLSSVDLSISNGGAEAVVKIYSSVAGEMGTEIATLTGTYVSGSIWNFTPATLLTLSANTTYWLMLYSTIEAQTLNSTNYNFTADVTYTGTGTIPTTNRVAFSEDAGQSWVYFSDSDPDPYFSSPYMFALYGEIVTSATWTGTTSTDWNTSTNWSTNLVPTSSANVTIPDVMTNDPVVATGIGASCNDLAVSSGATLTVQSGGSLITNGSITNNGSISIQRSVTNAAWHLVSAPTSNATANSFVSGDYLQSWSESTGSWTDITVMSTALNPVQGYGLWNSSASARTYTFTGTPNTGNQSISITAAGTGGIYNGANLLGNPYPSSIDWDGLRTAYGAVYYWNGSAYVSWNNGGTGVRYIPPMQGFFVITASNTSFSLTNFNRTHAGATAYYKSTEDETMNNGLVLYADNGSYQDELYVSIENETQEGFELQNDAWKLPSNTAGLSQLWSVCTDGNLSIDRRPATDVIQLGFTNDVNGTYAIGLKEINGISKALIEDTKTGLRHDLMTGNYSFAWEANEDANRFKLLFNAVGIDEQASAGFSAYAIGKTIYISNPASEKLQIKLIDLMGRTVLNQQTGANSLISIPTALNSGVYIIQITDGKQSSSTKVIIR